MSAYSRITAAILAASLAHGASAAIVEFFEPWQTAVLVQSGSISDTIQSEGYVFTYTRDKLFTGGLGGGPIGRDERVSWPEGIEAQAVTEGPILSGAKLTISRVDGGEFDLRAFTLKLLANTAATGAHLEIMPQTGGEDAFDEGFMFNVSGFYGGSFYFDTSTPAYLGNTTPLQGYESYKLGLFVDFALTSLTLNDQSIPEPTAATLSAVALLALSIGRRRCGRHVLLTCGPPNHFSRSIARSNEMEKSPAGSWKESFASLWGAMRDGLSGWSTFK